jgi:hypothetical protein
MGSESERFMIYDIWDLVLSVALEPRAPPHHNQCFVSLIFVYSDD